MESSLKKIIQLFAFSFAVFFFGCADRKSNVEAGIESFQLAGTEQQFEQDGDNLSIYVPYETDVTHLKTEIVVTDKATISPASGTFMDFTNPQRYTVKDRNGSRDYTVTVKKSLWRQVVENGTAPFLKVDGHCMVAFKDKLWLLGGWLGQFEHDKATFVQGGNYWTSQVWCTSDGLNWESKGNAPWAGRHGFGCVVHDDKLWVIGGDQHTDVWNTEDGVHWNKVLDKTPWGERYFPYIVSFKGKIWVMGGIRITFPGSEIRDKYNDIWSSTDGVHWTREVEFVKWAPRGLITGSAVLKDELYIYGGCLLYSYAYNDVWKTSDGVNWTQVTPHAPWPPRQWSSVASYDNKLWIMAGDFDIRHDTLMNDVWSSADGATWTQQKGIFWKPRHATPVVAFDNKLWLAGGLISRNDGGVSNDVWVMEKESLRRVALKLQPGDNNPRNSEGDFITLKDGRILFIYSHFTGGSSSDFGTAYLAGRFSDDGGKTWSQEDFTVVENEGEQNVMSVSLLRLQNGNIALFYARKNSIHDCMPMMRISTDEGKTWSSPVTCITDQQEYFVLNNNRVIQLKNGRLLMPVALHQTPQGSGESNFNGRGVIFTYYSDDNGKTWRRSAEVANPSDVVAQEPGVIELKDGTIMMFVRASGGFQQLSWSKDKGQTWTPMVASTLHSPISPASIARIPSTGDLLLVWNNNDGTDPQIAGKRTPLTVAVSKDEGKTWEYITDIETDPDGWYCYIAIHFTKEDVLLGYCAGSRSKGTGLSVTNISSFPQKSLYKKEENTTQGNGEFRKVVKQLQPGNDNPRNSEGDFVTLKNGRILFIFSRYTGVSKSDHAPAYLASRFSDDGGKTWSDDDRLVVEREGDMNVMSVSLLRLRNGSIALFYLRKNSEVDCIPMMRISTDEAKTWSDPITCITDREGYFVLNNNRVIQLKNGRLLFAVSLHAVPGETRLNSIGKIYSYYSDDNGVTWRCSEEVANPSGIISQEPGVIELKDGTIMMFIRASGGFQQLSWSKDKGQTWTPMVASTLHSPISPASIARIPSTGDLLLVWNNNDGSNPQTKDKRTPLTVAVSKDEGKTWTNIRDIETDTDGWYCYIAIHFTKKDVLLGYCAGSQSKRTYLSVTNISSFTQKSLYRK